MPRQKLTQRTDGYFKVKYHDKQFYGKTQAEAMKARDAYKQKEQMGLSHDLEGITFLDYALNWLEIYRSDCSVPLQKQYASMIRFAADHTRKRFICDINANDLQAIFNKLSCYSSSYVSKFASLMNGIFRNAVSNGALIRNPMAGVQRPKCKKTGGHRCLEPWERALIRSTWQEHDFGLAAMVMLYTGFRRGEMLHLNIDRDVDFEKKTIAVRGAVSFSEGNRPKLTKGKTASAIRTVPLLPPLEEALEGAAAGWFATRRTAASCRSPPSRASTSRTSPSWRRSSTASTSAGTAKPTSRSSSWRRGSCRRGRKSTSAATISAWSSAQEPTTRKCRSKRCKAGWVTPMPT